MSGVYGFDANPVHKMKNRARTVCDADVVMAHRSRASSNRADATLVSKRMSASEVEHVDDVAKVSLELLPPGEPLGPNPVTPHRFDRQLVVRDVGINPGTRVTVLLPHATRPRARLQQLHPEPSLAQPVQLIQATEPGPDHDYIELVAVGVRDRRRRVVGDVAVPNVPHG